MPRSFLLTEFLSSIAPNALCDDCIRDRMPRWAEPEFPRMMSELGPPGFERSTGECIGCARTGEVTSYVGNEETLTTAKIDTDAPDQEALFYIEGPDERGCVWMHGANSSDPWAQNLGPQDKVAQVLLQWLGSLDRSEKAVP